MTAPWWRQSLARYQPPDPTLRPGAHLCWCHPPGQPAAGREYRPGWFEHEHPEGLVRWYAGTAELPLGFGGVAWATATQEGNR